MPLVVLLMDDGLQVPTMPLGEVVFNVGAVVPLHNVNVVAKFGTRLFVIVIKTVSEISSPQLLVAVSVTRIVPVAFDGIVNEVVNAPELLKLPLGAVHTNDS